MLVVTALTSPCAGNRFPFVVPPSSPTRGQLDSAIDRADTAVAPVRWIYGVAQPCTRITVAPTADDR